MRVTKTEFIGIAIAVTIYLAIGTLSGQLNLFIITF